MDDGTGLEAVVVGTTGTVAGLVVGAALEAGGVVVAGVVTAEVVVADAGGVEEGAVEEQPLIIKTMANRIRAGMNNFFTNYLLFLASF